jgi:hypothetical protein
VPWKDATKAAVLPADSRTLLDPAKDAQIPT